MIRNEEILHDFPEDSVFRDSEKKRVTAIYHLQGEVSPGFRLDKSNTYFVPRYADDLGSKIDTGGQQVADFEATWLNGKAGNLSLMFAMSNDMNNPESSPLIRHTLESKKTEEGESYVKFLPFQIFLDAGITRDEMYIYGDENQYALVPKEVTMKHWDTLYPLIAKASLEFMREHIPGFNTKEVVLDGNYIDGGQTVLFAKEALMADKDFEGTAISTYTPHSIGLNKIGSRCEKFLQNMEADIDKLELVDASEQTKETLKHHPYLEKQRAIVDGMKEQVDPASLVPVLEEIERTHTNDISSFKQELALANAPSQEIEKLLNYAKTDDLAADTEKFSFKERLLLEGAENLSQFDIIMSTGQGSVKPLQKWAGDDEKATFTPLGFNSNIYKPDLFDGVELSTIISSAQKLTEKAYIFDHADQTLSESERQSRNAFQADQLENGTNFIAISRADPRKGSIETIKAFAQWAEAHPEKKGTVILGAHKPEEGNTSEYQDTIVALVKELDAKNPELHLKDRVLLLPSLAADEVRSLYATPHAVGLCPSLTEPFGLVGLEQFGSGIPIIASNGYQATNQMRTSAEFNDDGDFTGSKFQKAGISILRRKGGSVSGIADCMGIISENYDTYKQRAIENASSVIEEFNWEKSGVIRQEIYDRTIAANQILPFNRNATPDAQVEGGVKTDGIIIPDLAPRHAVVGK